MNGAHFYRLLKNQRIDEQGSEDNVGPGALVSEKTQGAWRWRITTTRLSSVPVLVD